MAELSDKLVEQSIEHTKRSRDFESSLTDLQGQLDQVRNARAELLGQATQLQEILQEREKRIKVCKAEIRHTLKRLHLGARRAQTNVFFAALRQASAAALKGFGHHTLAVAAL